MVNRKKTILVVDDQPKNLQLAAFVLKPYYELVLVNNGEAAIKTAAERLPDLILLDIMMPGMSGYEVCEALKRNPLVAEIPVIFLTAKIAEEDLIKAYDVGGVDYVTKPFRAKELLLRISTQITLIDSLQKIKRYNDYLKILNENKDKIFSAVAHDLKGTSGQITSLIDILLEQLTATLGDSELGKPLAMLKESSSRNFDLVNDLFSWSKSQFEKISPSFEEINLSEMLDKIVSQQHQSLVKKNIRLTKDIKAEECILTDRGSVEFVCRNLLSNAIKFVHEGGEIKFSFFKQDIYDVVEIKDDGIGMSPLQLEQLTKGEVGRSQRGTEGEKGHGLGFRLSRDFMQKIGGFLRATSEPGKGTLIQLWIPHVTSHVETPAWEDTIN